MFKVTFYMNGHEFIQLTLKDIELDELRKAIHENGFTFVYLYTDGMINLNRIVQIEWEEI